MTAMTPRQVLAGAGALVIVATVPVLAALERAGDWYEGDPWETLSYLPVVLASTLVGWLVVHRRPENIIGWLLLANGLVIVSTGVVSDFAAYGLSEDVTGARAAAIW